MRWLPVLLGVLALMVVAVAYAVVDPVVAGFPGCVFLQITSWYCPGCGVQRALHALLNGRVVDAFGHNALAVASLPVLVLGGIGRAHPPALDRLKAVWTPRAWAYWLVFAAVAAFWVLRNIQAGPFAALAP